MSNFRDADKCHRSEAEICVKGCDCKIEVENLCVHEPTMAHIRGRVCNQCGRPAKFILVSLVKEDDKCCRVVAKTRTDCEGCYEFRICVSGCGDEFKVVAHGKKHCEHDCDRDKDRCDRDKDCCDRDHERKNDKWDWDRDKDRCDWDRDNERKHDKCECEHGKKREKHDCDRDKCRCERCGRCCDC